MSGNNEFGMPTNPQLLDDGFVTPLFTDPFNLGQEKGFFPIIPQQHLLGLPSTDLLIINSSLFSTSIIKQPDTVAPSDFLLEQNSSGVSTTSIDPLTGSSDDAPLVGELALDELTKSSTIAANSMLSIPSSPAPDAFEDNITQQQPLEHPITTAFYDTGVSTIENQLTDPILEIFRAEAIARWASLGITGVDKDILNNVKLLIADLPGYQLGLTQGYVVTLDLDAAGTGWFVDSSPSDDFEFSNVVEASELRATEIDPAFGRVDLLTVITHEFGHVLGLDHVGSNLVISATLPIGTRRLPIQEIFHFTRADEPVNESLELSTNTLYRNAVFADSPSGYWSLDELTGTVAADSNSNGTKGSYLNGVTLGTTGTVGSSASFDGVNDVLEIPINSPETNYTYELWFKTSVATGGISIVRDYGGSHDRLLYLQDGNIYHGLYSYSGSELIGSSGKNYADNQWHHLAVVVQSGVGQKIYVDSSLVASGSKGASDFNWDTRLVIGETIGWGINARFNGSIDEVALYNSALSVEQIRAHYRAKSAVQQGAFPDLAVTNATVPPTVAWGQIPVSWTVTNQSGAATSTNWSDRVYLSADTIFDGSDISVGTFSAADNPLLEIGDSYTLNKNVIIPNTIDPNQNWYLLFVTDANVELVETDKSNNVRSVGLNLSMPNLVYFNNFESTVGSEWSKTTADNSIPNTFSRFNGRFSNDSTTLTLNTVPGNSYRLELDFYAIDSWEGNNYDYDDFNIFIDNNRVFQETFSYSNDLSQSYRPPDQRGSFGFNSWDDSIYRRIPITFTATGESTQIRFADGGLESLSNESWGIDNVRVWTVDTNVAQPELIVTSITDTASAAMNETVSITWTVKNQGTGTALNSWLDRVYLSKNTTYDSTAISLGTATSANVTPLAPEETYTLTQNFALPTNTVGDWNLLVATDAFNSQTETNETNNVSFRPLHIKAPDLVVTTATAPTTAPERSKISLNWTVTNQGEAVATTDWYDYVYLSDNTIFDSSDRRMDYLGTGDKTPLAPGASYTVSKDMALPERVGAGKQYLLFVADHDNYQTEASETNNVWAVPIDITVPDLVVTGANVPLAVTVGSTAEVSWTVSNQSNVQATHRWYDRVYLSNDQNLDGADTHLDTFYSGTPGTSVAAGDTYTLTKTVTIPNTALGDRYLLFVADADNNQYETDENNIKAISVEVNAPDLIVENPSAPITAALGEQITVNWQVTNQGSVTADANWYDYFYLSDDQIFDGSDEYISDKWTDDKTPLASNISYSATHNFTIPTDIKAGNRYLLFVADHNNNQGETNENNNFKAVPINIKAADLVVDDATTDATTAAPGSTLTLSYTIKNQGQVASNGRYGEWYDRVYLSTKPTFDSSATELSNKRHSSSPALSVNDTYTVDNISVTLPNNTTGQPGNRYLLFVTDVGNYQIESDESNNFKAISLTITGNNADLEVTASAPSVVATQQTVSVSWIVKNIGALVATNNNGGWYDRVYISSDSTFDASDTNLSNWNWVSTPLAVNGQYTLTRDITIPSGRAGSQYLLFVADDNNYQSESSKANNVKAIPLEVRIPDLQVTSAKAPNQAYAGALLEASWTVTNQGNGSALQPQSYDDYYAYLSDSVYLSDDDTLDTGIDTLLKDVQTERLVPLESGTGYTITQLLSLPNTVTKGSKYLLFVADRGERLGELNENNNVKAVPITIGDPDPNLPLLQTGNPVQNQNSPQSITNPNTATYTPLPGISTTGLLGQYYVLGDNVTTFPDFSTLQPTYTRVDPQVNFNFGYSGFAGIPGLRNNFAASWTGKINIPTSGDITFYTTKDYYSHSNSRLYIDGQLVIENQGYYQYEAYNTINLTQGEHDLRLEFFDSNYSYSGLTLSYTPSFGNKQVIPTSVLTPTAVTLPAYLSDLKISDVASPSLITPGQTISTAWTVTNQSSNSTQNNWYDNIYLSNDTTLNSTDTLLTGFNPGTTQIAADGTYTQTKNITIPTDVGLGNKYLLFAVNPDNTEIESDAFGNVFDERTNNAYALPVTITNPDLIVTAATAPSTAAERELITVNWTVKNQGNVPATASNWYDYVYLSDNTVFDNSDRYMGDFYIDGNLATSGIYSESQSFRLPENTGAGKWYVLLVADQDNYQAETSDVNNVYAIPIDITVPDLTITTTSVPTTAAVRETVSLSWTVKNLGDVSAAADWYDSVYLSDDKKFDTNDTYVTDFGRSTSEPLAAGATDVRTENITIPNSKLGDRYLLLVSDRTKRQSETDETNNVYATPITITAPDLVVSNPTAPIAAALGETVSVSWTVANEGNVVAGGDWHDYIYLSDDQIFDGSDQYISEHWTGDKTPLVAGTNYTIPKNITIPTYVKAGNRYLLFVADRDNYQGETNENNNFKAVSINIKAADLVVDDATTNATTAAPGDTLTLSYTIKNQGQVATNGRYNQWYDHVYLSTKPTFDSSATELSNNRHSSSPALSVNDTYKVDNISVTLPNNATGQPGNRYLLFVTDSYNHQIESDESNNFKAIPLTITGNNADLEVTASAPSVVATQQTVSVSWTVKNTGALVATNNNGGWYDRVYISSDNTFDASDTNLSYWNWVSTPLAVNGQYTLTRDITIPSGRAGSQYLLFVADDNNYQSESSKTNNIYTVPITVKASDLVVTDPKAPIKSYPNSRIEVSWTVKNQGNASANADWYDRVYLSDDTTLDTSTDTLLKQTLTGSLTPLPVGADYSVSQLLTLPSSTPIGTRYLLFVADGNNAQSESDESNNFKAIAIVIGDTDPDLVITAATAPNTAVLGEFITVNWTVKNQGNREVSANWYNTIYVSDDEKLVQVGVNK